MRTALAIDIGASSGRGIIGWIADNELVTKEIYRFDNYVKESDGHLVWDIEYLVISVKETIRQALRVKRVDTVAIDTWGVDYVLLNGKEAIHPCYAYRDQRTKDIIDEVHSVIPFCELYVKTGSQFQIFNSIYQLYWDKKAARLDKATDFLMIPEYLNYKLTGKKVKEFTNATTTGLINSISMEFDQDITNRLGLQKHLFTKLAKPGYVVGDLTASVQEEVGGNCQVILCATHDTASAVEGIPMQGDQLYISSGTWSLLGVKTAAPLTDEASMKANYSNEGGVGYNRYQKNIMGMWLVQCLRKELCPDKDYNTIVAEAALSKFDKTIDCDSPCLLSPSSMIELFNKLLPNYTLSERDYFYCAYNSLAKGYEKAIKDIENNTNKTYDEIYIVGGGAKNCYLNELTERYTGKKVLALPIEATALGNLKIQLKGEL